MNFQWRPYNVPVLAIAILLGCGTSASTTSSTTPLVIETYQNGLKPSGPVDAKDLGSLLKLSGARGETLNFTLQIRTQDCVELSLSSLSLSGTSAAHAIFPATFKRVLPYESNQRSFAAARIGTHWDALVPMNRYCPNGVNPQGGGPTAWILGEFKIPKDAKPGTYTGKVYASFLASGLAGGLTHPTDLPVEVKVWPMTMPDRPSMPLYSELTTWFLLLGHYGKWHEGESALAQKYIQNMLEHRMLPLKNWVGDVDPRKLSQESAPNSSGDTFYSTLVKPLPAWASFTIPMVDKKASPAAIQSYFSVFERSLRREHLLDRSFLYFWDEPTHEEFPAFKRLAKQIKAAAPGIKILATVNYEPSIDSLIDVFVPVMDLFDRKGYATPETYLKLKKAGKEFWLYTSCMSHGCTNDQDSGSPDWVIDRTGPYVRAQAWVGMLYQANGLLYYSVDNAFQYNREGPDARDPWKTLWDFTGHGDGTLYYPGRPGLHGLTEHQPVESLRLKLWRQSSYDAEYIQWMNQLQSPPAWWKPDFDKMVKSTHEWSKSDRDYQKIREKMGDYLSSAGVN